MAIRKGHFRQQRGQLLRGNAADCPTDLDYGELFHCQDTNMLVVGGTSGNELISEGIVTDAGTANARTVTLPYLAVFPKHLTIISSASNTAATTITINSLAAKDIKTTAGADPGSGAIATGAVYKLTYDGTNYQLI